MGITIKVADAGFSYNGSDNVFENIGFSITEGEILSILGPNGTGKTSLLKCLNGLHRLTEGQISVDEQKITGMRWSDIGKKVGYIPQAHDSTFPYTVLEMVRMGRAPHIGLFSSPTKKDTAVAEEAIEELGISHLKGKAYTNLSGGEAQLVLIARALAAEPKALLLDEPTSHLDFKNQAAILNLLEKLSREHGLAIIMTTHFPDHALSISDKALLMANGKGGIVGRTAEVINENSLKNVFGIEVKIISFNNENHQAVHVVPIRKKTSNSTSKMDGVVNC